MGIASGARCCIEIATVLRQLFRLEDRCSAARRAHRPDRRHLANANVVNASAVPLAIDVRKGFLREDIAENDRRKKTRSDH
jgi:hypothetical protein